MNDKFNWSNPKIESQLELQVKMQFENHNNFIVTNGLSDCRTVLEIGVGDGTFLRKLAQSHPEITFRGVDNDPGMRDKAIKGMPKNMEIMVGNVEEPTKIPYIDSVDAVLMRYLLLHLSNKSEILDKIHSALKPNTRLWIIDLDLENFISNPACSKFDWIKTQVQDFCESHGKESNYSSALIRMLKDSGFHSINKKIEPLNNKSTDIRMLSEFIQNEVIIYREALGKTIDEVDLQIIQKFVSELDIPNKYVNYGVALVSAVA